MNAKKNILVAPINWGLGHATRCIPIIYALQRANFTPILASDGDALALLKKEFPTLEALTLPEYDIKYTKKGWFFKLKLALQLPKIIKTAKQEQKLVAKLVTENRIDGIISDNRFGVYNATVPSIYITHQLTVLNGCFTFFSSKIHQHIIRKFKECWIPDFNTTDNFTGKLSQFKNKNFFAKHIGVLSRFQKTKTTTQYDYLVLLSGPEPQRSLLKEKLLLEFKNTDKKVAFVLGNLASKQTFVQQNNIIIYNFMTSKALAEIIQGSKVIIARSGYTTIMDLAILHKKAFFIPTPGQTEQLYLAKRLQQLGVAPFATQHKFKINALAEVENYKGLASVVKTDFTKLFRIFN